MYIQTVHMINGNFLEPKVFGKSLELHPVVVLLALAFWVSYALCMRELSHTHTEQASTK